MSGDHNMYQKSKSYLDDFECPRCGHCCQALVDETAKRKHIKTWHERCEEHPDHQEKIISERMIQARMQEEIDELRQALEQDPVAWISEGGDVSRGKRYMDEIGFKCNPLYTAPCQTCQSLAMAVMNDQTYHEKVIPKREWVGLTDQEIGEVISGQFAERNYWVKITKALESKLKEKNT